MRPWSAMSRHYGFTAVFVFSQRCIPRYLGSAPPLIARCIAATDPHKPKRETTREPQMNISLRHFCHCLLLASLLSFNAYAQDKSAPADSAPSSTVIAD